MGVLFTYIADHDSKNLKAIENTVQKPEVRLSPSVKRSIVDIAFRRCSLRLAARINGVPENVAFDVLLEYLADRQERAIQAALHPRRAA